MQNEAARKAEEQFRATRERELRGREESVAAANAKFEVIKKSYEQGVRPQSSVLESQEAVSVSRLRVIQRETLYDLYKKVSVHPLQP